MFCLGEDEAKPQVAASDIVLSVGGDGTILRAARMVVPHQVPILGINLGNLGFMAELDAAEALDSLPALLNDEGWIEERAMLEVELMGGGGSFNALNDVFIGRGGSARLVRIEARINSELLTTYRADGVIVATATGSTSYSLATGGPILYPKSKDMLLEPVCPHLTLDRPLVLPPETVIELRVSTSHQAMLSVDGQVERLLSSGDGVKVKISPYITRFLRVRPESFFYSSLVPRLRWKV